MYGREEEKKEKGDWKGEEGAIDDSQGKKEGPP